MQQTVLYECVEFLVQFPAGLVGDLCLLQTFIRTVGPKPASYALRS